MLEPFIRGEALHHLRASLVDHDNAGSLQSSSDEVLQTAPEGALGAYVSPSRGVHRAGRLPELRANRYCGGVN